MKRVILLCLFLSGCNMGTGAGANPSTSSVSTTSPSSTSSNGEVLLSWAASTGSPMEYEIAQSTDSVNYTIVSTVTGSATSAYISGLNRGTMYYFKVQAVNGDGSSGYSTVVSAKP